MFENSLLESRVSYVSPAERWTALASIGLQCAVAGMLVVVPLLHPERLIPRIAAPPLLMPLRPKPLHVEPAQRSSVSSSISMIASTLPSISLASPLPRPGAAIEEAPVATFAGPGMSDSAPSALGIGIEGPGIKISIAPVLTPTAKALRISEGVSAGLLLVPIRPVYPAIAKSARVQGTVVVEAVISRNGTIESLHAISGPPMLQRAAIEAIQAARYQPYRLNGEPTEVATTITVNFRLGA